MVNLAIICEGKTERNFADMVLKPHLLSFGILVSSVEIGVDCLQSGGNVSLERVLHDAELLLNEYEYVTTLFDFYRLGDGWRDVSQCDQLPTSDDQARYVEEAALQDAKAKLGVDNLDQRLILNVLMHEFEGILFTDVSAIVRVTRARGAEASLLEIVKEFATPEDINTGRNTAPSKRLVSSKANYGKIVHGARIAKEIGLSAIREKCPHFNRWLKRIEGLGVSVKEV